MKTNQEYVEEFLKYLQNEKNYSKHTVKKYKNNLRFFIEFLDDNQLNFVEIELKEYKKFTHTLYNMKMNERTISNYISAIKSFNKYLYNKKYITNNIAKDLSYPKKREKLPKILYNNEVKVFLDSIDESKKFGKRNKALFLLLYSTGIRVSECSNLKLKDINYSEKLLFIFGKGSKERTIPVNENVLEYLKYYIKVERKNINKNYLDYIFINNKAGQLTDRGIRYLVKKISMNCDLNNISPHTFRHSLATSLLREGMDLRFIQEILGHESLSSTEVYTNLNDKEIKNQYLNKMRR